MRAGEFVREVNAPGELRIDPDLIRRFTDAGWQIDGEGRDQIVMSRPGTNRVLKIVGQGTNTHIAEIRRAVQFFRDHQRNPHFPRVGQDRTFNWKGRPYYVYTQERLAPLSRDEEILDYLESVMGEIGHGEDPDYSQAPPGLTVEQVDGLVSAIYDMFDAGMLTLTNFDLGNTANIMQRANGQLVIVDPASHMQDVTENSADGHTPADAVLDYVKRKHHDFRGDREVLMYPRWQLAKIPLRNLIIADYTDSDIDLDQVDVVKRDPEQKINQSPIVVDPAGAIIDGNHRAFAARELGMTHIPAWRPVDDLDENFADGKKPGRKGLSRRVGIPKKATLKQLSKIAKSSTGERRRMAQWQLNMRRGKARKNK
jgi:hypothetical protein